MATKRTTQTTPSLSQYALAFIKDMTSPGVEEYFQRILREESAPTRIAQEKQILVAAADEAAPEPAPSRARARL